MSARQNRGMRRASLPVRGAWIEMSIAYHLPRTLASLPVRGAWIEMFTRIMWLKAKLSLPVRGAWIEIQYT